LKSPIRQINSPFLSCSSKKEAKQFNQLILYSNLSESSEDPLGTYTLIIFIPLKSAEINLF